VNLLELIQSGRIYLEGEEITRKGVNVPLTRLSAYLERRLA